MGTTIPLLTNIPNSQSMSQSEYDVAANETMLDINATATGMNAVGAEVEDNANTASGAATTAQTAADIAVAGASIQVWVAGAYNAGDVRYSPSNYLAYRAKTTGTLNTDPANDPTNWAIATIGVNAQRVTVASASTPNIWGNATALVIDFTGTATVTGFPAAPSVGAYRILHCAGACTFQHSANLIIDDGLDLTVLPGDIVWVHAITTTTFRVEAQLAKVLPIFGAEATARLPLSVGLNLTSETIDVGLSNVAGVAYGSGLFVAYDGSSSTSVATSADGGDNWILRTMPSSQVWRVGAAGLNLLAIDAGGASTAKSTDGGLTWSAATNCTINADSNLNNVPVENGGAWLVDSATASTCAVSTDHGSTWANQTLPADNAMDHFLVVGGVFWYWASSTNARTSATGLTGSWTARTLPVTPGAIWSIPGEDAIYIDSGGGTTIYKTTDGINWVDAGIVNRINQIPNCKINNVYVSFGASAIDSYVQHGDRINRFWSQAGALASNRFAINGAGNYVLPFGSSGVLQVTDKSPLGVFR